MEQILDRRRTDRSKVMLVAGLERGGAEQKLRIADLSADGALVLGCPGPRGTVVRLRRGSIELTARVAWSGQQKSGLSFDQPADVSAMLRPISQPRHRYPRSSRRPGLKSVPLTEGERRFLEQWASEGRYFSS
jgi:hypothetical protein